jgi:hypothetical protein
VQREFERVIRQHIENLGGNNIRMNGEVHANGNALFNRSVPSAPRSNRRSEEIVEDLEDSMPGSIPTISNQVSNHVELVNGHAGGKHAQPRTGGTNGYIPNGRPNFRTMLEDAEMDSHI